jgi:hypothetical protein
LDVCTGRKAHLTLNLSERVIALAWKTEVDWSLLGKVCLCGLIKERIRVETILHLAIYRRRESSIKRWGKIGGDGFLLLRRHIELIVFGRFLDSALSWTD